MRCELGWPAEKKPALLILPLPKGVLRPRLDLEPSEPPPCLPHHRAGARAAQTEQMPLWSLPPCLPQHLTAQSLALCLPRPHHVTGRGAGVALQGWKEEKLLVPGRQPRRLECQQALPGGRA